MGAGAHYPYPKEVWSPSGGWWTRPKNWGTNTAVALIGIGLATFGVWRISARNENRHRAPTKAIPSQAVRALAIAGKYFPDEYSHFAERS